MFSEKTNIEFMPPFGGLAKARRGVRLWLASFACLLMISLVACSDIELIPEVAEAPDIDTVANPPEVESRFTARSSRFEMTGSISSIRVPQRSTSETFVHE